VARWQFSGEDLVAVVGCDFGSFLQHEGETRLVRRCTKGRNGGLGPMLFFCGCGGPMLTKAMVAAATATRGGAVSSGLRR
jgi:hypothetical protein